MLKPTTPNKAGEPEGQPLRLKRDGHKFVLDGHELTFGRNPREAPDRFLTYRLLVFFYQHPNEWRSREDCARAAYGIEFDRDPGSSIDSFPMLLNALRVKLGEQASDPEEIKFIRTDKGGYIFNPNPLTKEEWQWQKGKERQKDEEQRQDEERRKQRAEISQEPELLWRLWSWLVAPDQISVQQDQQLLQGLWFWLTAIGTTLFAFATIFASFPPALLFLLLMIAMFCVYSMAVCIRLYSSRLPSRWIGLVQLSITVLATILMLRAPQDSIARWVCLMGLALIASGGVSAYAV